MTATEIGQALHYYRNLARQGLKWPIRYSLQDGKFHCGECGASSGSLPGLKHTKGCLHARMEAIYNPGG